MNSLSQLCANAKTEMDQYKLLEESPIPKDEAQKARVKLYNEIKRLIDNLDEAPASPLSSAPVTNG